MRKHYLILVFLFFSYFASGFMNSGMGKDNATVKVLIEGYARQTDNGWIASSTCCYIESAGLKIITDPGCNRTRLFDALLRANLKTSEIDIVFLSHGHPDHTLLAGVFENARYVTYDANLMYEGDSMTTFEKSVLGENIEILETPGHVPEHISLLVRTEEGIVAVAGDVFWWADGEKQTIELSKPDLADAVGMDMKQLIKSRNRLLNIADVIIPGHGKAFSTKN